MIKLTQLLAAALTLICLPAYSKEATGVIRGQVIFTGTHPAEQAHTIRGDKYCQEVHAKKPILKDEVIINSNNTISNVVVWLDKGGPDWYRKSSGATTPPVELTQLGCVFTPHVVALQTDQKLLIKNADKTLLNVNAQPARNPRLNTAIVPGGKPVEMSFTQPEVAVKLKSDIHPWMVAYAAVFDHPGFDVTAEDGTFEIRGVPPGEYVLKAWQEKFGTISLELIVAANEPTNAVFTYTNDGSKGGMQVDSKGDPTTGTKPLLPHER